MIIDHPHYGIPSRGGNMGGIFFNMFVLAYGGYFIVSDYL